MRTGASRAAPIGLTNVADRPLLAEDAAKAVIGTALDKAALDKAAAAAEAIASPAEDARGSVEYRTKMAGVMTRRALQRAFARAQA